MMYSIRPFQPSPQEYAATVAVRNAAWPDERQESSAAWQTDDLEWPAHALNQRFVVEHVGTIVGEGTAFEAYWEGWTRENLIPFFTELCWH